MVIVKGAGGTTGDWNGAKMTTGEENSCLTLGLVTDETNEEPNDLVATVDPSYASTG